ncbi:MAG: tetratricopeptide repeat protein [Deltaproteobacteria bacterium]|nr:tetratricopeptide repeat protein [Deltaproteobacteria bacterium]
MSRYEYFLDMAYDALDRRSPGEAMTWCKKAITLDPGGAEAYYCKGEALDMSGMWQEAVGCYRKSLEQNPDFIEAILNLAEILLDDSAETLDEVFQLIDRGERVAKEMNDDHLLADVYYIRGNAYYCTNELDKALKAYDRALELVAEHPSFLVARGMTLFLMLDYEAADKALQRAVALDPESAEAHHNLGLVKEKLGQEAFAIRELAQATRLDPERFPKPARVAREEFEKAVEKALAELPEPVKSHLRNVAVIVEDYPSREQLKDLKEIGDPQLLGVFNGTPYPSENHSLMPGQIHLFQRNIEKVARDRAELEEQIRITVAHEVGHYYGMSEEDLAAIGLD